MPSRPRLTPAMADVRRAVRESIVGRAEEGDLLLVGLSGGPDSVALAAAAAFELPRAGMRAGAVVVDHGLQPGSDRIADAAADLARRLGLEPVVVHRVDVGGSGGPEAAARAARHAAFDDALDRTGARFVLLAHTLDDQAETVLLGLARGSGPDSLSGMDAVSGRRLRPLLAVRRATTHAYCADAGIDAWADPHNDDEQYRRVRVRATVLPALEDALGPGIAEALARTADQLREDSEALDQMALEWAEEIAEHAEAGIALSVSALAAQPAALRHRLIRLAVHSEFGVTLSRSQTLAVARLITHWHGQNGVDLPGARVERSDGQLVFSATA
ncbi:tRNA lysidine(34) synthetase TilS [Naasia lichenicola]|uniref:tRNA(Ile)-lysidine synthase n=1 Tax=Naasia lichenicola TaxID=2565933 RepID=A0A4S4FIB7_9MICO|nr:tRNA lysidine(34) synthetase TilS [Naasia lichenicola]THG29582.1 tRNA lysidine(34) synthetase TilS [Naasia lichenicola]